jgi:L-asparaginase/Glu-tRNA(Gln) amidotransferase subunit D
MTKTLIITTGGTIEAEAYSGAPPENVTPLARPFIQEALEIALPHEDVEVLPLCNLDSKSVTPDHLQAIAAIIKARTDVDRVIVTHGTDTMIAHAQETADKLEALGVSGPRVVFTGAMKPLMNGMQTDGWSHLANLVRRMEEAPQGVSIYMHGQFFDPDHTRKDYERQRFTRDSGDVPAR